MASKTGVANSALIKLGAKTVTSIDPSDGTKTANIAAEQYDKTRLRLLRRHPWNCAIERVKLARLSDVPAFEFDYYYQLPTDWLRCIAVSDNAQGLSEADYRIEGRKIASSASDIYLRYVKDLEDVNEMDPTFREALACALALDMATALTASSTLKEQIASDFTTALLEGVSVDSIEDAVEEEPESEWITARY